MVPRENADGENAFSSRARCPTCCYPETLARELTRRRIRFFDYKTQFAQPLRDEIRAHAERLAQENGLVIEAIRSII
jgi:hypothetical protein